MQSDSIHQGDGPDGSVNGAAGTGDGGHALSLTAYNSEYPESIPKKTDYVKLGLACTNICGAFVPPGLNVNSERNTNVKKQLTRATFKLFSTTFMRNGDVTGLKMLIFRNGSASVLPQTAHLYFLTHIISIDLPSAVIDPLTHSSSASQSDNLTIRDLVCC